MAIVRPMACICVCGGCVCVCVCVYIICVCVCVGRCVDVSCLCRSIFHGIFVSFF